MTNATSTARPRGAARREALLQATLELLGETGADVLTHRRVAERAQLPLASTTYWFESKEHLLTAALAHAADRDVQRLHDAAAELDDVPVPSVAQIATLVVGPDAGHSRSSLLSTYALMLEAARRPALQEVSQRWTDAYLQTLGGLLARAGSRHPGDDARLLVAAIDGLLIDHLSTGAEDAFDPMPELARLTHALLEASR